MSAFTVTVRDERGQVHKYNAIAPSWFAADQAAIARHGVCAVTVKPLEAA
jgi:hypothetical protein